MGISVAQLVGLLVALLELLALLALLALFALVALLALAVDADGFGGVYVTGTPPIVNAFIVFL